jgi:hypothetical protein
MADNLAVELEELVRDAEAVIWKVARLRGGMASNTQLRFADTCRDVGDFVDLGEGDRTRCALAQRIQLVTPLGPNGRPLYRRIV